MQALLIGLLRLSQLVPCVGHVGFLTKLPCMQAFANQILKQSFLLDAHVGSTRCKLYVFMVMGMQSFSLYSHACYGSVKIPCLLTIRSWCWPCSLCDSSPIFHLIDNHIESLLNVIVATRSSEWNMNLEPLWFGLAWTMLWWITNMKLYELLSLMISELP